jgi:hypothetical protein
MVAVTEQSTCSIDARARRTYALVNSGTTKHRHTLTSMLAWTVGVVIYAWPGYWSWCGSGFR